MTATAIDTCYKGRRFRSRIEARWAVFFDHLGAEWIYEREGFRLSTGPYLPDFYLPQWKLWVEVRPKELRGDIETKLAAFRSETNQPIILLGEQFGRKLYRVFCWDISDSSAGCYDGYFGFAQAPCGAALLVSNDARLLNGSRTFYSNHELTQPIKVFPLLWPCDVAAERAQSSRFEHGEQG